MRRVIHYFVLLSLGLLTAILSSSSSTAQQGPWYQASWFEHPELYLTIQDTLHIYLIAGSGDTLNPDEIHAGYGFDMLYDSTGEVIYKFTECRRNSSRLKLAKWRDGRAVNADAPLLSFNSTTDTFTCHTGDTLSFYREVRWRDPKTGWTDTDSYYALDALDYAVELVRLSDSTRIALLDSIGMLPSLRPARPSVHGMYPLIAQPRYTIPEALNGVKTFIRLRVYHRGPGQYWFTRTDDIIIAPSARLVDSSWFPFINLFTPAAPKIEIDMADTKDEADQPARIDVSFLNGSTRDVAIDFANAPRNGGTAIGVYDITGTPLFLPYLSPASDGEGRVLYRFDHPGTFFIGLLNDNRIIASRKIVVN